MLTNLTPKRKTSGSDNGADCEPYFENGEGQQAAKKLRVEDDAIRGMTPLYSGSCPNCTKVNPYLLAFLFLNFVVIY